MRRVFSFRFSRLPAMLGIGLAVALSAAELQPAPAMALGPTSVADVAQNLLDAVVNISTSQNVTATRGAGAPEGSGPTPFREFFDQFFDQQNRRGDGPAPTPRTRRVQSLGSG